MSGSADQRGGRVLFVTAVRLRRGPKGLQLDDQTCAGLARWAESFGHVTYMGIEQPADLEDDTSVTWIDIADLHCRDRLTVVALPFAYKIGRFFKDYKSTRKMLGEEIAKADHLCFTLGYLFGDWAAVAALEAIRQNRDYAVWFDRVEHDDGVVVHAQRGRGIDPVAVPAAVAQRLEHGFGVIAALTGYDDVHFRQFGNVVRVQ